MPDLSILIPARQEQFLNQTVDDILANIEGDTEVIVVCDGNWPFEPLQNHPKLHLIFHPQPIGQRAATNEAAKISNSKYIMKCDAHCSFDKGFDVKLMAPYESGEISLQTTTIPRMYNLHAFDWVCLNCNDHVFQGPKPKICKCGGFKFDQQVIWKPRLHRRTDFARFDNNLIFQYWPSYEYRPAAKGDLADVMSSVGAGWLMPRTHYWDLGGVDEGHGSWGQMGTEIACKSWLSGGRQVVNKRTWFCHLFRTQYGFGWPYEMHDKDIEKARAYSRHLWLDNNWPLAIHPLEWLVKKFAPVPTWETNGDCACRSN